MTDKGSLHQGDIEQQAEFLTDFLENEIGGVRKGERRLTAE
jgi:hypothetical protein